MAVGGVGDEHVDAGLDQGRGALPRVAEVADRRTDEQPAVAVVGRVGELLALDEVLDGDQATEASLVVDEGKPLALVLAQQQGRLVAGDAEPAGDQRHRGHDLVDLGGGPLGDRREAQVAVGDDAEQLLVEVDDRQPGDAVLPADPVEVLEGRVGPDGDGVGDDPGLGPLHEVDLVGLVVDREVAVEHADAALAGHRDRHPALGDGVHRSAHQRRPQRDLAGQPGRGVDVGRCDLGVAREQQHVVVGEAHRGELLGQFLRWLHSHILPVAGTLPPPGTPPTRREGAAKTHRVGANRHGKHAESSGDNSASCPGHDERAESSADDSARGGGRKRVSDRARGRGRLRAGPRRPRASRRSASRSSAACRRSRSR